MLDHVRDSILLPQKEDFALIVSLEGLRKADEVQKLLEQYRDTRKLFDLVIIDEAHYLRNSSTKSLETGERLRDTSEGLLLLSATPIQTGSDNFYNLLKLLSDEHFHDKNNFQMQLSENYPLVKLASAIDENAGILDVRTLLQKTLSNATYRSDSDLRKLAESLDDVMASTSKRIETVSKLRAKYFYDRFVTRTRKRDVMENRTERIVKTIDYQLSPVERDFYERVTSYLRNLGDRTNAFNNFSLMMRQRQMTSCMPAALASWRASAGETADSDDESFAYHDVNLNHDSVYHSALMPAFQDVSIQSLADSDTKFHRVLETILDLIQKNPHEKIVIFSFFRTTVQYLDRRFKNNGLRTVLIMGGMEDADKEDCLSRFRDANINILVSTEVGSEGIDLQFAKYEINYDLPWNPMRIEQRIGRLDRIGQESPNIFIFNAFCGDTIEDRILSRLYARIQVFKDSIGDLEEILGEVIQNLELDIFLHEYQTEDADRKAQQVEQAIAHQQRINQDLEIKSGMLSVYQEYVLNNIKTAHDHYRRITADELMFTVQDFLNKRFPGSTVKRTAAADSAMIRLSSQAADDLLQYTKGTEGKVSTSLCHDRQGTLCCFGRRGESKNERTTYREIVDINHPLIRWIVSVIKAENAFSSGCSAVQISKKMLPESLGTQCGIYTFYIQQWIADGAKRLNELHYYISNPSGGQVVCPGHAETILTVAALYGDSFDTSRIDNDDLDLFIESINELSDYAWEQFDAFESVQKKQNNDLIRNQEQYIRRTTEIKIENFRTIMENLRLNRKGEQVIKMWEGRISHATEDMEDRVRRLRSKFDCPITSGDVAVGILAIRE